MAWTYLEKKKIDTIDEQRLFVALIGKRWENN